LPESPKNKESKAVAVDENKSSPGFEHFNKQELIDKFGGDSKECEELLKMALEKIPGYIAGLKKEIEGNDFKTIKKAAHKLKGAALFVSFNQLGNLAKKLEHNEKHDIGVVKGVLEEIEREFEEVKKVVERKEIEGNDFKTIKKAAHKLKGAALFVSFNQLGTLAKKLEHNEKHDIGVVKGLLEEIEREFEEVKKVVERHGA